MKTINLRGISESLNEEELKNVVGGSQGGVGGMDSMQVMPDDMVVKTDGGGGGGGKPCDGKKKGDDCEFINVNGYLKKGICEHVPFVGGLICNARDFVSPS
jgi:hypothetical protein